MKPTKVYELLVRVPDTNLSTVIDVLTNAAEIVSLSPYAGEVQVATKRKINNSAVPRRHEGGVDAVVLASMVPGKKHSANELGRKLALTGFSANSVYPSLSALGKNGKVRRVAPNTYELV